MINKKNKLILFGGLLIPLLIFLNRFLMPDLSFDSVNYHVFSGNRFIDFWKYIKVEFFPVGLHSFPPFFDYIGGVVRQIFGYRLGTITSLLFLYGLIFILFYLSRIFIKSRISSSFVLVLFFINIFISLEIFFQLATYFVDILGAFFVIWSISLFFKYVVSENRTILFLSSLLMGVSVAGKLTNLIYLVPFVLLVLFWEIKSHKILKKKLGNMVIFGLILLLPIAFSFVKNTIQTGNPVFPFYNLIFKSKYYPTVNFENTAFGGRNFIEKLFWPIFSIYKPERLSEAHDLFNDFKLNFYFVLLLPSIFFSYRLRKKDLKFYLLNLYILGSFLVWNFSFGYLRYAFVLEILCGFVLLVWVSKLLDRPKNVVRSRLFLLLIPLLFFLGYLDAKAIKINLAYDLSWRKTLFYNRTEYSNEFKHLFVNNLDVISMRGIRYPDIYLNCSAPGLSFYSLSQFSRIPIVNIDDKASRGMTTNKNYNYEVYNRVFKKFSGRKILNFVTITGNDGLTNQYHDCKATLEMRNFVVNKEIPVDNFLGFDGQKLVYIFGEYSL